MMDQKSLQESTKSGTDKQEKRGRGRPRIENYVSPERIVKAYKVHKTLKSTANALCIDIKTLKRVLNDQGIEIHKPTYVEVQKYGAMSRREGCFAKWLKHNPGVKLPPNVRKISEITGCSYDSVKSYLRRRRNVVKELVGSLPDIREIPGKLEDTLGYFVDTKNIKNYKYRINKYSCDVFILVELYDGTFTEIHISNIKDFQSKLEEVLK